MNELFAVVGDGSFSVELLCHTEKEAKEYIGKNSYLGVVKVGTHTGLQKLLDKADGFDNMAQIAGDTIKRNLDLINRNTGLAFENIELKNQIIDLKKAVEYYKAMTGTP